VSAHFEFNGLEELIEALRTLPARLAVQGGRIVETHGNRAEATIKAGYPVRLGDLRDKLTHVHTATPFGARSVIKNTSQHAAPFELGSEGVRVTKAGWNRGRMPPNPLFTQTMRRERRAMYRDFGDLLTREGLVVSGDV
jgi:hypothetical protein